MLALGLVGCGVAEPDAGSKERDVEALSAVVSTIVELRVTDYNDRDWCRHLSYKRSEFTTDTEGETGTCNDIDGRPKAFDDSANNDFERLRRALANARVDVRSVWGEFDPDGTATSIVFSVEHLSWDRWYYICEPGAALPDDMENELRSVRINDDWYWQWEDWN